MALILIVDDRGARRSLVRLLGHAGHSTLEAPTASEALERIRAEPLDLVVTGILMPGMDACEFVRRVRAEPGIHQPRLAFWSASAEAGEVADACGVPTVIPKHASPHEVLTAITAALEKDVDSGEIAADEFDRALRLLNQKLVEKVDELEDANVDRSRLLVDLATAHELERTTIASDIHDDSIQVMSAAALRLEMLGEDLVESEHRGEIAAVADKVRQAVGRLRRLIFDLSPRDLASGGLGPTIASYLREVGREVGFGWSLDDRLAERLPDEVEAILYRIAQEAIRNAQKHAGADTVNVSLRERDGGCVLRIADDGVGFSNGSQADRPGHVGLASMRERAAMAGGTLELETAPGAGCQVEVWVPEAALAGARGEQ